ncbi:MAG: hypothetical protein V4484_19265 [Pseudomonadota bacterium]
MPFAWNLTRRDVHYRHECFSTGLRNAGYELRNESPQGRAGDVLLIWNRYGQYHDLASRFERQGGTVIVAENGYLGRDENGNQYYALALHGHNGSGQWWVGGPERFEALGIPLQPWRRSGDKIVIRGQRGIGAPGMASPPNWHADMAKRLRAMTKRPVQVIPHPGNGAESNLDHEQYLQGAHALVIWSSAVGVKALAMGIPVFYDAPDWICAGAAHRIHELEIPYSDLSDMTRLGAMQRMAWAQWKLSEIESGLAFKELLL